MREGLGRPSWRSIQPLVAASGLLTAEVSLDGRPHGLGGLDDVEGPHGTRRQGRPPGAVGGAGRGTDDERRPTGVIGAQLLDGAARARIIGAFALFVST